jgi:hypothetical protein
VLSELKTSLSLVSCSDVWCVRCVGCVAGDLASCNIWSWNAPCMSCMHTHTHSHTLLLPHMHAPRCVRIARCRIAITGCRVSGRAQKFTERVFRSRGPIRPTFCNSIIIAVRLTICITRYMLFKTRFFYQRAQKKKNSGNLIFSKKARTRNSAKIRGILSDLVKIKQHNSSSSERCSLTWIHNA